MRGVQPSSNGGGFLFREKIIGVPCLVSNDSIIPLGDWDLGVLTKIRIRLPRSLLEKVDEWIEAGKFRNRSDAIRTLLALYFYREKL